MSDLHINQWVVGPDPVVQELKGTPLNHGGIIFPAISRAAAVYTSAPIFNPNAKGVRLYITNDGAGGSTAIAKIQVQNPATGVWIDLAGATTGSGTTTGAITTIYPGLTGIADSAAVTINQHLGSVWRVVLTVGTATGTNSVGADYLL
jgi:hypothetical protein